MAVSRAMILLSIMVLLVCLLFIRESNAAPISYGAVHKGDPNLKCHGSNCLGAPKNGYNRGCQKSHDCRGGKGAVDEEEKATDAPDSNEDDEHESKPLNVESEKDATPVPDQFMMESELVVMGH